MQRLAHLLLRGFRDASGMAHFDVIWRSQDALISTNIQVEGSGYRVMQDYAEIERVSRDRIVWSLKRAAETRLIAGDATRLILAPE